MGIKWIVPFLAFLIFVSVNFVYGEDSSGDNSLSGETYDEESVSSSGEFMKDSGEVEGGLGEGEYMTDSGEVREEMDGGEYMTDSGEVREEGSY